MFINACRLLSALPSLSQFGRGRLSLVAISFYGLSLLFGPCRLLEFTPVGPLLEGKTCTFFLISFKTWSIGPDHGIKAMTYLPSDQHAIDWSDCSTCKVVMSVMWFILSCTCFPEHGVMKFVTSNFNFFSFHSCFRLWTRCTRQLFVLTWKDIQHSANGNSTELETSCSHTSNILPKHSVCTESWILEKVLIFPQLFSRHGKGMENRDT